jgi:hypothetical protein
MYGRPDSPSRRADPCDSGRHPRPDRPHPRHAGTEWGASNPALSDFGRHVTRSQANPDYGLAPFRTQARRA